jgi:hypothetical protein
MNAVPDLLSQVAQAAPAVLKVILGAGATDGFVFIGTRLVLPKLILRDCVVFDNSSAQASNFHRLRHLAE